jgi:hypothetical protein
VSCLASGLTGEGRAWWPHVRPSLLMGTAFTPETLEAFATAFRLAMALMLIASIVSLSRGKRGD